MRKHKRLNTGSDTFAFITLSYLKLNGLELQITMIGTCDGLVCTKKDKCVCGWNRKEKEEGY